MAKAIGKTMDSDQVIAALERKATRKTLDGMARYAIPSDRAFGVMMRDMKAIAKQAGKSHELADALWKSGFYEARMVASMVDEPDRVTPAQMERWCKDFDNWAIVDTVCFVLFDRTPHAWKKVAPWCRSKGEMSRRAGFVLIACLAAHDKAADDTAFERFFPLIERGAADERNFVMKGVSWALRMVGRRSRRLHATAVEVAQRLAASPDPAPRWVGKDALRELSRHKPTR